MKPSLLIEQLLYEIEQNLTGKLHIEDLAGRLNISAVHLQRLFRFIFEETLASYIRSRKLSASLDVLLNSDKSILSIALEYGFEYEQSYIRAFRNEFDITPGALRKSGQIVKITPPLHLFDVNKIFDGITFSPEIVMVPEFYCCGKRHQVKYAESLEVAPALAMDFWLYHRAIIIEGFESSRPDVYLGLTTFPDTETDYNYYLPAIQVPAFTAIPSGYTCEHFPTSLCARFRYIGQHPPYDINREIAAKMYAAIRTINESTIIGYQLQLNTIYFERVDLAAYDGKYCTMEWFTPVIEKREM